MSMDASIAALVVAFVVDAAAFDGESMVVRDAQQLLHQPLALYETKVQIRELRLIRRNLCLVPIEIIN